MAVFICIYAVYFIVRGHNGFRFSLFYCNLKTSCIEFPKGTFVYYGIICHTSKFLTVCCEMFRAGCDSLALDSTDVCCCHFSRMIRIFGKIFKVSSAKRASLNIQSRTKNDVYSHCHSFLCQCCSDFFPKLLVPTVCYRRRSRKTSRRKTGI